MVGILKCSDAAAAFRGVGLRIAYIAIAAFCTAGLQNYLVSVAGLLVGPLNLCTLDPGAIDLWVGPRSYRLVLLSHWPPDQPTELCFWTLCFWFSQLICLVLDSCCRDFALLDSKVSAGFLVSVSERSVTQGQIRRQRDRTSGNPVAAGHHAVAGKLLKTLMWSPSHQGLSQEEPLVYSLL